jgi:hypothetical protein
VLASFSSFVGIRRVEVYENGTVYWPICDAREGWVTAIPAAIASDAMRSIREMAANGTIPENGRGSEKTTCFDDVFFRVTLDEDGRSRTWAWFECEEHGVPPERSLTKLLAPLFQAAGSDPCRQDAQPSPAQAEAAICATRDPRERGVIEREIEELRVEAGQWGSPSDPLPYRRLAADYFELACRAPTQSDEAHEALQNALMACSNVRMRTPDPRMVLPIGCPARR